MHIELERINTTGKEYIHFSGSRFPGNLNMDMNELSTNLVAYPKLHYIFSSISPMALTSPTINTIRGTK